VKRLPLTLVLLLLGCSPAPQLRLVDVGSDGFLNPMPFALRIVNDGRPVEVDEIVGDCRTVVIVSPDPDAKAPHANLRVGLTADMERTLPAGDMIKIAGTSEVYGVIGWELPDDSPPVMGFVEARFTLRRKGVPIFTVPNFSFIIQNREGVYQEIVAEASRDPDDARALLKVIDGMKGTHSAQLKGLRALLKAGLPPSF
jgi:hypothetical protein